VLLVALAAAGCRRPPPPSVLAVGAAASLRELVQETAPAFAALPGGARLVCSFSSSATVARQVAAGSYDVFLSADAELPRRIADHLVPGSVTTFLANRLVVVGREGLSDPPRAAAGLLALPGKLALGGEAVPAGRYARQWLAGHGLLPALRDRIVQASDVRAALALVEHGAADAAIVYATDARLAEHARVLFPVPEAEDPGIRYVAAVTAHGDSEAARAYLAFLLGEPFQQRARALGFLPPPGGR
jgi:molybdate transport system substrate-binding protein